MRVYDNGSRPELAVFDLDGTLYPRERYVVPHEVRIPQVRSAPGRRQAPRQ
jgi:FMN phosphatase YigB (HAD superfamily)